MGINIELETEYRVRDVAYSSISHEQTQSSRVCGFQPLDAVFPKDLLYRLSPAFFEAHLKDSFGVLTDPLSVTLLIPSLIRKKYTLNSTPV